MDYKEEFLELWQPFTLQVKGKLMILAQKQRLALSLANLALKDAAGAWGSDYERQGRWLKGLAQTAPDKAATITKLLLKDLRFEEVTLKKPLAGFYDYLVPAVGFAAGWSISRYLGASKLIQGVSAVLPMVALYPAVQYFRKSQVDRNKE